MPNVTWGNEVTLLWFIIYLGKWSSLPRNTVILNEYIYKTHINFWNVHFNTTLFVIHYITSSLKYTPFYREYMPYTGQHKLKVRIYLCAKNIAPYLKYIMVRSWDERSKANWWTLNCAIKENSVNILFLISELVQFDISIREMHK